MIKVFCVGPLATNCYVFTDDKTGASAIIDPAYPAKELLQCAKGLDVKYILLTHGHIDHIFAALELKKLTGAKILAHRLEKDRLLSPQLSLYQAFSDYYSTPFEEIKIDCEAEDTQAIEVGDTVFNVMHTPGHTEGSVCFVTKDIIFSGDTLFCGSYGRVDFPGGNMSQMIDSFCRLCELSGNYTVLPGHGDKTQLETERTDNLLSHYYLQGLY